MNRWLFISGMFLASFLPRTFPVFLLKDREISPAVQRFLKYIPVAIFTALVSADIFFWEGSFSLDWMTNIKLLPSVIVLFISFKFQNLFLSMLAGVVSIAILSTLF